MASNLLKKLISCTIHNIWDKKPEFIHTVAKLHFANTIEKRRKTSSKNDKENLKNRPRIKTFVMCRRQPSVIAI